MRKILFFVLFFNLCAAREFHWHNNKSVVFFDKRGGRLGNQLMGMLGAYYCAYKNKLPVCYHPFEYSDQFYFDDYFCEREKIPNRGKIMRVKNIFTPLERKNTVHLFTKSKIHGLPTDQFFRLKNDARFLKHVRKLFRPKEKIPLIEPPSDCYSVALHVRTGEGFDRGLSSVQIFDNKEKRKRVEIPSKTRHFADQDYSMKFPPEQYYIDQLIALEKYLPNEHFYVYLFTDSPDPEALMQRISAQLPENHRMTFDYRREGNRQDRNVLCDFYSMMNFDCLIRPGNSTYSLLVNFIGDFHLSIFADDYHWEKDEKGRIYLIMDDIRFMVNKNYDKKKKFVIE